MFISFVVWCLCSSALLTNIQLYWYEGESHLDTLHFQRTNKTDRTSQSPTWLMSALYWVLYLTFNSIIWQTSLSLCIMLSLICVVTVATMRSNQGEVQREKSFCLQLNLFFVLAADTSYLFDHRLGASLDAVLFVLRCWYCFQCVDSWPGKDSSH